MMKIIESLVSVIGTSIFINLVFNVNSVQKANFMQVILFAVSLVSVIYSTRRMTRERIDNKKKYTTSIIFIITLVLIVLSSRIINIPLPISIFILVAIVELSVYWI